jgi:myo-inositol-1(or 4)-monophosphatase
MDYSILCDQIVDLVYTTGNYLLKIKQDKYDIKEKGFANLVTSIDIEIERVLKGKLKSILPQAGFIGEEKVDQIKQGYTWIVDPIDGTTNFIHGLINYSISICLVHKVDNTFSTLLGVVYEPETQTCYYSIKNIGSFKKI